MKHEVKYPEVEVELTGTDGNAFAIIGAVQKETRRAVGYDEAASYVAEAYECQSYDALLQHAMRTVNVS